MLDIKTGVTGAAVGGEKHREPGPAEGSGSCAVKGKLSLRCTCLVGRPVGRKDLPSCWHKVFCANQIGDPLPWAPLLNPKVWEGGSGL